MTSTMKWLLLCIFIACVSQTSAIRLLGGYEKSLARLAPNNNKLALSHGTVYLLNGYLSDDSMLRCLRHVIDRHIALRSTLSVDRESWVTSSLPTAKLARKYCNNQRFESDWHRSFDEAINPPSFEHYEPQWRILNLVNKDSQKSAWVLTFNHALDDQQSTNAIVNDVLTFSRTLRLDIECTPDSTTYPFPPSIEQVVAPEIPYWRTIFWAIYQVSNSLAGARLVPDHVEKRFRSDPILWKSYSSPDDRRTFSQLFELDTCTTSALIRACKKRKVSLTHLLTAAINMVTSALIQSRFEETDKKEDSVSQAIEDQRLRFLLSVSLRPFASEQYLSQLKTPQLSQSDLDVNQNDVDHTRPEISLGRDRTKSDWAQGTVACAAGALDYIVDIPSSTLSPLLSSVHGRLAPFSAEASSLSLSFSEIQSLWSIALMCSQRVSRLIEDYKFVPESVRLFGLGMQLPGVDILKAVEIEAANSKTMGRAYSCGLSNAGKASFPQGFSDSSRIDSGDTGNADHAESADKIHDGDRNSLPETSPLSVENVFYGVSHGRNGCLVLLSTLTVKERICGCLQFTSPLTSWKESKWFTALLTALLKRLANETEQQ